MIKNKNCDVSWFLPLPLLQTVTLSQSQTPPSLGSWYTWWTVTLEHLSMHCPENVFPPCKTVSQIDYIDRFFTFVFLSSYDVGHLPPRRSFEFWAARFYLADCLVRAFGWQCSKDCQNFMQQTVYLRGTFKQILRQSISVNKWCRELDISDLPGDLGQPVTMRWNRGQGLCEWTIYRAER